ARPHGPRSFGERGVVGDLAVIDDLHRSADVVADEPTRIAAIDARRFVIMMGQGRASPSR
ncbi:MAG: hypothetical protein ACQETV_06605, partial [Actinomycetota bacterium]